MIYTQTLINEKIALNIPNLSKIKKVSIPFLPLKPPKKLSIMVKKPIAHITKIKPFTNKPIIHLHFLFYYLLLHYI